MSDLIYEIDPTRTEWSLEDFLRPGNFPEPKPVVEGLISEGEFVIISGAAKVGKSLLAANLGLSVALGRAFLGKYQCVKNSVLILQTEISKRNYSERLRAMISEDDHNAPMIISTQKIKLGEQSTITELGKKIKNWGIKLVVIDPFYNLHGRNEDNASEMAPILSKLASLSHQSDCALVVVHHQGKRGESDSRQTGHQARGSSAFADVPDASWSMTATKLGTRLAFEMRNRETPNPINIERGNELWWRVSDIPAVKSRLETVAEIVMHNNPIEKLLLTKKLNLSLGIQERTAHKLIEDAVSGGLIKKKRDGSRISYSTANDPAELQSLKDLQNCRSMEGI